ncbi:MAG: hypothetical protein JWL81_3071, partial [Verrucomicrobiales bacterium]|nr:hypothetical protein [Verrucomicrobiales bacterium]
MGFSSPPPASPATASDSAERPDTFDIYNQAAILRRWPEFSDFLKTPPPTASSTPGGADAFLLSLLWKEKSLRRRFPRALTDGPHGLFAKHLISLAPAAAPLFRQLLENPPGLRIVDYYIRESRLHPIFPAGLIP